MAKARKSAKRKAKAANKTSKRSKAKAKPRAKSKPRAKARKTKARRAKPESALQSVVGAAEDAAALRLRLAGSNTFED